MPKLNKLEKWLNEDYKNPYNCPLILSNKVFKKEDFDKYYNKDDTDLNNPYNNEFNKLNLKSEIYDEKDTDYMVYIKETNNRYHTNYLFKKLVDYCNQKRNNNKCTFNYYNEYDELEKINIFTKNMKNEFYKFCYENSI